MVRKKIHLNYSNSVISGSLVINLTPEESQQLAANGTLDRTLLTYNAACQDSSVDFNQITVNGEGRRYSERPIVSGRPHSNSFSIQPIAPKPWDPSKTCRVSSPCSSLPRNSRATFKNLLMEDRQAQIRHRTFCLIGVSRSSWSDVIWRVRLLLAFLFIATQKTRKPMTTFKRN